MTFDRAIDFAGVDGGQFAVFDGDNSVEMLGTTNVWQDVPGQLGMVMAEDGPFAGAGVTLTVGAANGIVAAGDGAAFAGVTDLELPWP